MSEETYSFLCPSCSAHLSVPVSIAGVTGPCPYCGDNITSPMPDSVPEEDLRAIAGAGSDDGFDSDSGGESYEQVADYQSKAELPEEMPEQLPEELPEEQPGDSAAGAFADNPWSEGPASFESSESSQSTESSVATSVPPSTGALATEPSTTRKGRRKKRGQRVPKGKKKQRRDQQPQRPSQAAAIASDRPRDLAHIDEPENYPATAPSALDEQVSQEPAAQFSPPVEFLDKGQSTGMPPLAKIGLGLAAVAAVALGALFGLPYIMGNDEGDSQDNLPLGGPQQPPYNQGGPESESPTVGGSPDDEQEPTPQPDDPPIIPDVNNGEIPGVIEMETPNREIARPADGGIDPNLPESLTNFKPAQDSILSEPRAALDSFLAAPNWRERMNYSTGGSSLENEMRAYYTQYPDTALDPVSINWLISEKSQDGKAEVFIFVVALDIERRDGGYIYLDIPAVVENRGGKCTVDWNNFVEFKDRHLYEFITKRVFNSPQKFHVTTIRTHYFGSDPELKKKLESGEFACVQIDAPGTDEGIKAFLNTRTKKGKEMVGNLGWAKAAFREFDTPLVELCWKKTSGGAAYIEITDVLGLKWRQE